ncbi:hypothetical protein C8F01DRAFT_1243594 [Mycena amicta]|nr:hypothetical protein C8F01DRAFT_1243594 [Mycena amicta]
MSNTAILPDGTEWLLREAYTTREVHGVTVLVVISCISLLFVVGLLSAIALSAFNTRSSIDQHLFVRTHVAAYFISLLISDLIQAIGSILNARWIHDLAVEVGPLCTAQGVLKQIADVATAFWTVVIAIHTFCLLFLELKSSRFTLIATLISGWFGIAAIVIAGPAALDTAHHGPFYGISGYWCWIGPRWTASRIGLDYLYPIAYTILILPIAASRFSSFAGDDVPFGVTVFSAAIFLLSGIVNVTLFTMTRRILPPESFKIPKWSISQPKPITELTLEPGTDSYYQSSGSYAQSIEEKEKGFLPFESLPPALTIRTAGAEGPTIHLQPPPAGNHRDSESRVESVYNMYAEPTSAIPLTPADDAQSHVHRLA